MLQRPRRWAEGAVIYQIYPRSFQDSNGDGVGDLPGITQRLDYLQELGVTGIWLSPFYPSPMADFGYDISDYQGVDPLFGTLHDFQHLLHEAHNRDIKVIIDIVPNHTSDQHKWYKASAKSRDNKYSDWYIWHDPKDPKSKKPQPPNNWLDMFAGRSAWQWSPTRRQYYLHSFSVHQPDLNWANPEVREAMKDMLRYWLRMGVDGFRVDAVPFMAKNPEFRDDPPDPDYKKGRDPASWAVKRINSAYWPAHFEYLRDMASVLREKPFAQRPRLMITEGYVPRENVIEGYLDYYRMIDPAVASPFVFEGIERPWDARDWRWFLRDFHEALANLSSQALPSYAFSNHDQYRLVTRFGAVRARAIAVLQLTLPGITFVYYGEELGMHNVKIPKRQVHDPSAQGGAGRDGERTPMEWSDATNAGFSDAPSWLPVARDYRDDDVESEKADPLSFLNLYHQLIRLRRESAAINHGSFRLLTHVNLRLLAFARQAGNSEFVTVVNFDDKPVDYYFERPGHIMLSSLSGRPENSVERRSLRLKPFEAVVISHN